MSPENKSRRNDIAIAVLIVVAGLMGWYFAWVRPHDQFTDAVLDCVGDGVSKETYVACEAKVRAERSSRSE